MISKVTESNKELIKNRIADINKALQKNGSSTVITNLESYYANIVEISKLTTDFHNAPYKYFLMPLDEPVFEIDANKRTITVPAHFSKNGIGVRGDHMAEVLYFKIDKYFDYQDLFAVDEIIINWQFHPSNASRNAAVETHTSIALAPDDTYDPGHIVFGWVITEDMTPSKGTLSFSISFIKRTDNSYKYALNTQTASVIVNDSLTLEDPSILENLKSPIFERLADSRFSIDNVIPLEDPTYKLDLPSVVNFDINEQGVEPSVLTLTAIGTTKDDGNIQYTWNGTTAVGDDNTEADDDGINVTREPGPTLPTDFIKTSDTEPKEGVTYYYKVDNEFLPFTEHDEIGLAVDIDDNTITLEDALQDIIDFNVYEVGSSLNVNKAGLYQVTMQSVKSISQTGGEVVIKSGNVSSQGCEIPVAAVPLVTLTANGVSEEEGNYTIVDHSIADQYIFVDEDAPKVSATIDIDTNKIFNLETGAGKRGVTENSSLGAVALIMKNVTDNAPQIDEFLANEIEFKKCSVGESLSVSATSAGAEGDYLVYAANRRNHTYSISDASNELKVSFIAPILTNISVNAQYNGSNIPLIYENNLIANNKVVMEKANGYSCNFHVAVGDAVRGNVKLQIVEVEEDENHNIISYYDETNTDTPNVYDVDDDGNVFMNDDAGHFIVRAITTYNGTQRITETKPFLVTDDR